jgi:hypothetical protein
MRLLVALIANVGNGRQTVVRTGILDRLLKANRRPARRQRFRRSECNRSLSNRSRSRGDIKTRCGCPVLTALAL